MNIWVGYGFLFPLLMGSGLWLCSCLAWVTKRVSSWPTAPKVCASCLCDISWVLLVVLTDNSHSTVKVLWDHMYLCQVWNNLPPGIPPWGSSSSFWPSNCTSGSSSSFPWRSQASQSLPWQWQQQCSEHKRQTPSKEVNCKSEFTLPSPGCYPVRPAHCSNRGRGGGHINMGILECCEVRRWEKIFDLIKCGLSNHILKSSWNTSIVCSTHTHTEHLSVIDI